VRWGAATGLLIANYTVIDAYGVKVLGIQPVILDRCWNLLRFVLLTALVPRNRDHALARMDGQWLLAVGVGVLSPLTYILVLIALEMQAPLSLVAPMREMSMDKNRLGNERAALRSEDPTTGAADPISKATGERCFR
jgi:hypothetical protein